MKFWAQQLLVMVTKKLPMDMHPWSLLLPIRGREGHLSLSPWLTTSPWSLLFFVMVAKEILHTTSP